MSIFRRNRKEAILIVFFTCLKFSIYLLSISRFGFQRDELLHLALADHPAFGYMEVPPFVSFIAWLGGHLFGNTLFATRLIPSAFGAMVVYLTGLIVLSMGGKRFAITVACLGMIFSPAFLASGYLLQPVVFDQFFWTLTAFLLVQFVKTKERRYLYWLGVSTGFGMMNKYTMLLYAASLLVGVLVSGQRKLLLTRQVPITILISFVIFSPNLFWQYIHHFPVVTHMQELDKTQLEFISPINFLKGQLLVHATGLFIWLPGFIYLFFSRVRSRYVFLSFAYLSVIFLLALLHGKIYYGFGAYPALFAVGGICWQRSMTRLVPALKYSILTLVILPSLFFVPIVVPILSFPDTLNFFEYMSQKLDFNDPLIWEDQKVHATTQDYGDMLGWNEIADNVNKAYLSLSEHEKKEVTIFAGNYGMAGAVDHLGKKFGLPKAVCLNSSYKLWAPDNIAYDVIIFVDDDMEKYKKWFGSMTKIGEVMNPYAREKGTAVYVFRHPLVNINEIYRKHK